MKKRIYLTKPGITPLAIAFEVTVSSGAKAGGWTMWLSFCSSSACGAMFKCLVQTSCSPHGSNEKVSRVVLTVKGQRSIITPGATYMPPRDRRTGGIIQSYLLE